jgi:hypothetical protein
MRACICVGDYSPGRSHVSVCRLVAENAAIDCLLLGCPTGLQVWPTLSMTASSTFRANFVPPACTCCACVRGHAPMPVSVANMFLCALSTCHAQCKSASPTM